MNQVFWGGVMVGAGYGLIVGFLLGLVIVLVALKPKGETDA